MKKGRNEKGNGLLVNVLRITAHPLLHKKEVAILLIMRQSMLHVLHITAQPLHRRGGNDTVRCIKKESESPASII